MNGNKTNYTGYEYKEVTVPSGEASFYLDCYENFGWQQDANFAEASGAHLTKLRMKRDRKILNKMELTRLQRHFESCTDEIERLEKSKTSKACGISLTVGFMGTVFMAGSTFAVVHEPPIICLCVLLAVPGFIGWILPYFLYRRIAGTKTKEMDLMIEAKREEIYEICERGHSLL